MKKILSVLTVCLATLSPLSSQTRSNDSCIVPCESLRKAILVKADRDNLKKQITKSRDSISVLQEIIVSKDTTISSQKNKILVYKSNEVRYEKSISLKDSVIVGRENEIKNLNKDVKKFKTVSIVSLFIALLTIIF